MRSTICTIILAALFALPGKAQQDYYFTLNYSMAAGLGEQSDFIGNYSWRGVSLEPIWMLTPEIGLGAYFSWNVFYDKLSGSFTEDTETITGTQARYINAFPMLLEGRYHLGEPYDIRPYLGLGIGAFRMLQETNTGLFGVENKTWHFGISPNAGILIPIGYQDTAVHVGLRYNKPFNNSDAPFEYSWLGIDVGLSWLR